MAAIQIPLIDPATLAHWFTVLLVWAAGIIGFFGGLLIAKGQSWPLAAYLGMCLCAFLMLLPLVAEYPSPTPTPSPSPGPTPQPTPAPTPTPSPTPTPTPTPSPLSPWQQSIVSMFDGNTTDATTVGILCRGFGQVVVLDGQKTSPSITNTNLLQSAWSTYKLAFFLGTDPLKNAYPQFDNAVYARMVSDGILTATGGNQDLTPQTRAAAIKLYNDIAQALGQ